MAISQTKIWFLAARPKTLPAAAAPVVIGTALAVADGRFHGLGALCALLGALLIQIGTNFANDYFDHVKGTDTIERIGPLRVTQAGLVRPATMRAATALVFLLACVPGLYLVVRGGWVFVAIGLASILCGVLYTAGPYPLGYHGLGDLFVLVFFGPIAVAGTYYAQALELHGHAIAMGFSTGLFAVAILTVNNLRDIDQDRVAGKKTLAVRWGRTFARWEYLVALIVGGGVIPLALCASAGRWPALGSLVVLLLAAPTVRAVFTRTDGPSLNNALASTGQLLAVFSLLFSIGWMV